MKLLAKTFKGERWVKASDVSSLIAERDALQARVAELEKSLEYAMRENP